MISNKKRCQMRQIHGISRQTESSEVNDLLNGIYPKRINKITPPEYRLETGQTLKTIPRLS